MKKLSKEKKAIVLPHRFLNAIFKPLCPESLFLCLFFYKVFSILKKELTRSHIEMNTLDACVYKWHVPKVNIYVYMKHIYVYVFM